MVTHSDFLRDALTQQQFANADYRILDFADAEDGRSLILKGRRETEGGGMGRSPVGFQPPGDEDFPEEPLNGEAVKEFP